MTVDELGEIGMARMDDEEIHDFLAAQGTGVLGLPAPESPYLVPLSFGYDGGETLYFTYVLGGESRKAQLSDQADVARFLVYHAETPFSWRSVLLTGSIEVVPDEDFIHAKDTMENAWRPDLLEGADLSGGVELYQFVITDRSGMKHTGLPPGLSA